MGISSLAEVFHDPTKEEGIVRYYNNPDIPISTMKIEKAENLKHTVQEVDCNSEMLRNLSPESQKRFETLALENLYFKVHSHENIPLDKISEKVKANEVNLYVLAHGWTGTNEIFDSVKKPPHNQTIVEEILANDPKAIIICPDADGFGKTHFKDLPEKELIEKAGPEGYAEQMDFLLGDIVKLDRAHRQNVYVMGHSLGAAMTIVGSGRHYFEPENCVAVCPALIPKSAEGQKETKYGKLALVETTYSILATIMQIAERAKKLGPYMEGFTDLTIDKVTNAFLFSILMGDKFAGSLSDEEIQTVMEALFKIHLPQTKNAKTTSLVMKALVHGVDLSKNRENPLDEDYMGAVDIFAGENDVLAPVQEVARSIAYQQEITVNLFSGALVVPEAGHYAVLFEKGVNSPTARLLMKAFYNRQRVKTIQ